MTINTHLGLFSYTWLPFGISTALALWQKAMTQVLQGIAGVVYFIDDILITGRTRQEHESNLKDTLSHVMELDQRTAELKPYKKLQPQPISNNCSHFWA